MSRVDLDMPGTQAQFGDLVGISQQAVSLLVSRAVLHDGAALGEWLLSYTDHLREIAAGRGGDSSLVLAAERARLAREQADRIAMQNALSRKELAPAHLLEEVLAKAGARAARILETIPGEIRRRCPQLTSDDIAAVTRAVAKARNIAAAMSLADLDKPDDEARDAVPGEVVDGDGDRAAVDAHEADQ